MSDEPVLLHTMPQVLLVDAKAAGVLLGVPTTWLLAEARRDRVPHVRLGRYVRSDPVSVAQWEQNPIPSAISSTYQRTLTICAACSGIFASVGSGARSGAQSSRQQ